MSEKNADPIFNFYFGFSSTRSINSGFQALRATLPTSLTTDSKAVILRKAVSRISYLEGLLQKNNISFSNDAASSGGPCEQDQEGKKEI